MDMSLTERLLKEAIPTRKMRSDNPHFQEIEKLAKEISLLKKQGYVWEQINEAVEEERREAGIWQEGWKRNNTQIHFNYIRKTCKKAKNDV